VETKTTNIYPRYAFDFQQKIKSYKVSQIVAQALGDDICRPLLMENQYGFRGLLALVCGYVYHTEKSRTSIKNLIQK
jgi:hypothetical protein